MELFTSEGCHSCPPADAFAAEIADRSRADGTRVYVLGFHVDYWDRLGWKDRFSTAEATRRQHRYAARWNERTVYTPQMVINGTAGFVGSDRRRAHAEIARGLEATPAVTLRTTVTKGDEPGRIELAFDIDQPTEPTMIVAAVVEHGLETDVERGENRGKTLAHADVVRSFAEVPWTEAVGGLTLRLPDDLDPARARVVSFAQRMRTLEIVAADADPLPEPPRAPAPDPDRD